MDQHEDQAETAARPNRAVGEVPPSPLAALDRPQHAGEFELYTDAELSGSPERWNALYGQAIVRNVSRPTITPFLPDPAKATGAAVIVAPGGGFKMLSLGNEGWPVGRWLAERGIAAFVLKYRLNAMPDDDVGFGAAMMALMLDAAARQGNDLALSEPRATLDALEALRQVRAKATSWKIDPSRVGLLGFSAGAITALNSVLDGGASPQPAFLGYVYGPMSAVAVPADAPPMFAALALDDPLFGAQGFGIVDAWRSAGVPVELHAYEKGGHGYGMAAPGTTTEGMMEQFVAWLAMRELLSAS